MNTMKLTIFLNETIVKQKLDHSFNTLKGVAKVNLAFGYISKKIEDGGFRWFYAPANKTLLGRLKLVCTNDDLAKYKGILNKTDVIELCSQEKMNSNWRFYKLTNLIVFAARLKDVPVGYRNAFLSKPLPKNDEQVRAQENKLSSYGLYSLQMLNNWLGDFYAVVWIEMRSCIPQARPWDELQIRSSLLTCRTSNLSSFFLDYTTRWRQFCSEYLYALPSRRWCTPVSIGLAGYCLWVRKSIWILFPRYFLKWTQKSDSLSLHLSKCWKNDQVSPSRLSRWEFPLCNWIRCVSPFQTQNRPRNDDMSATPL